MSSMYIRPSVSNAGYLTVIALLIVGFVSLEKDLGKKANDVLGHYQSTGAAIFIVGYSFIILFAIHMYNNHRPSYD